MSRRERAIASALIGAYLARVVIIVVLVPVVQQNWFGPFLSSAVTTPSVDPWQTWLDAGGDPAAFPYGALMLCLFALPTAALAAIGIPSAALWAIPLVLLLLDAIVTGVLSRTTPRKRWTGVLLLWTLGPLLIYATFVHGQLDLVPSAFAFLACLALARNRYVSAGLVLGLAAAFKLSVLLVVPVVVLFLLRNSRFRHYLARFLIALIPGLVIAIAPAVLPGYRTMVLSSPQLHAIFEYRIPLANSLNLLVAPLLLAVIALLMWRYTRANPQMLLLFVMLVLFGIPLLSPGSPGWFVWAMPLIVYLSPAFTSRVRMLLILFWVITTASCALLFTSGSLRFGHAGPGETPAAWIAPSGAAETLGSLLATLSVTSGLAFMYLAFRNGMRHFDSYQLSRKPLAVAVAGDSGTGKDTLCRSLADVFGGSGASFLMGDDYHLHERGAAAWNVHTHLNPAANDLSGMSRDYSELIAGRAVWSQHYDHSRGRFTKARLIHHGELVVASGLHALATEALRDQSDLTVFLDMDERLRLRLKAQRDIQERGHSVDAVIDSFEQRRPDRDRFVLPQREIADLILRLYTESADFDPLDVSRPLPPVGVMASFRALSGAERIARSLRSVVGSQVDVSYTTIPGRVIVSVPDTAWVSTNDVRDVAGELIERVEELSPLPMTWQGGSVGITQLMLVLALLERRRSKTTGRTL